jgi:hypothetical protein
MDALTLKALRGSIAKWEAIVAGTGDDKGHLNCSLCQIFHTLYRDDADSASCSGCPVFERTGETFCDGTPYGDYINAFDLGAGPGEIDRLAQAELDFLRSLLPDSEHPSPRVVPVTAGDPAPLSADPSGLPPGGASGADGGGA